MPEPFCQTFKGKLSINFPEITSFAALIIALLNFLSKSPFLAFTIAADFLIMAIDLITIGLTKKSPILKYLLDL